MAIIKPKRLAAGQTIGIVAPSSPCNEDKQMHFAVETMESFGFKVKEGQHLYDRHGYLAGTDRDRATDVNAMFADDEVDAIITLRGGYGSARLLPYIDYDLIRNNPKVITGYSDVTALLCAIQAKTGLVTFNGPDAEMRYTPYTLSEFKKVLFNPTPTTEIGSPPSFETSEGWVEYTNRLERILPGKVRGQLLGGTMRILADLIGTPYEPDYRDKILVLEEVGSTTDEVDRSLSHLWLAGKLQQVKGIAFGQCVDISYLSTWAHRFTLEHVLAERCLELGIRAITGLMFGHIDDFATVPIGCQAELDVEAGTLPLLEPAVI